MLTKTNVQFDARLAAVCGLFCPACSVFIASHDDPARRLQLAARLNVPVEAVYCDGCHAEKRYLFCQTCKMSACATEKGLAFCGACADYPCEGLQAFQAECPHRIELWQDQERIQAFGATAWFEEKLAHYACPTCETLNSAYDLACRNCGATPSCAYVELHEPEIRQYLTPKS